jgi:hypothetical protein
MTVCRMPQIRLVAFEDRLAKFIFVAVPNEFGRYLRTDRSVAYVACENCGSTVGEPCQHRKTGKYHACTHAVRRDTFNLQVRNKVLNAPHRDVVIPSDGATVTIKAGHA